MTCHALFLPLGIGIIISSIPVVAKLDDTFSDSAVAINRRSEVDNIAEADREVKRRRMVRYLTAVSSGVAITVLGMYCEGMISINDLSIPLLLSKI